MKPIHHALSRLLARPVLRLIGHAPIGAGSNHSTLADTAAQQDAVIAPEQLTLNWKVMRP